MNALVREGAGLPIRVKTEDFEVHRTRVRRAARSS